MFDNNLTPPIEARHCTFMIDKYIVISRKEPRIFVKNRKSWSFVGGGSIYEKKIFTRIAKDRYTSISLCVE